MLLADDDDFVREALAEVLEALGFEVVGQAEDGARCVELAAELRPDVVLMDVRMPVMDGLDATAMIRLADPAVQVVMLSVYDDPAFREEATQVGALCYLVKEAGPQMLDAVVRSAASLSRQLARSAS